MARSNNTYPVILTLSCPDKAGIVAKVTDFLFQEEGFIEESTQFGDAATGRFFLRVKFTTPNVQEEAALTAVSARFAQKIADGFAMDFTFHPATHRPRVLLMVSQHMHCLNDLMYRYRTGSLQIEIPAIISNHKAAEELAKWHGIPFYYFPLEAGKKPEQEAKVLEVIAREDIELVVLARYMQILSPELCDALKGRCINIHHSFLPSFKGAKPYHQAFARGVKLIGATAHYVTSDLDEGPIIEQEVARVDHTQTAEALAQIGHDIEALVLARAVKMHIEQRVLVNANKTVVFR